MVELTKPKTYFPRVWEEVDKEGTARLEIYGGWLVYSSFGDTETMCFVPDPEHKWILVPKEVHGKEVNECKS